MKTLFRRAIIILLFAASIPSCDLLEDCKSCYQEENDNGTITKLTTGISTCVMHWLTERMKTLLISGEV